MDIDSAGLADIRTLAEDQDIEALSALTPLSFSLGAVVELACIRNAWSEAVGKVADKWINLCAWLQYACVTFERGRMPSLDDPWAPRSIEFFPIRGRNWSPAQHYHPFESRFTKGVRSAGFGATAVALAGALFEMADNVVQHSVAAGDVSPHGLIGYVVVPGYVSFSIADAGRGALSSLKENPAWADLPDSRAALLAILQKHASRRSGMGEGEGFKEVYRSIANLNGIVEVRSHDGRATLMNQGGGRQVRQEFIGFAPGFQLSISCSLREPSKDRTFPVDISHLSW